MAFDPAELDTLSRDELILRARARGVERPEQMTRIELRDEIVRLSEPDLERQRRSRGFLGIARDLLASVVESGLNLPDAAAAIRGDGKALHDFQGPPPVATVTLAEIYATQGHYEQALSMLDEVIAREPEHTAARKLRDRIAEERDLGPGRRRKVVETKAELIVTPQPPAVAEATPEAAPAVRVPDPPVPQPTVPQPAEPEPPFAPDPPLPEPAVPQPEVPEPAVPTPEVPEPSMPEPAVVPEPAVPEVPVPEPVVPEPAVPVAQVAAPASVAPAVLVLRARDRAFVYWRLPAVSGALRLRSVTVSPSSAGSAIAEEDFALPRPTGGFWLSRVTPSAELRAALGELTSDGFSPLFVARVVDSDEIAGFEPPGSVVDAELETAARLAAGL